MCSPRMVSAVAAYRLAGGASCGEVPCCSGSRVTGEQLTLAKVPASRRTAGLVTALEPGRCAGRAAG